MEGYGDRGSHSKSVIIDSSGTSMPDIRLTQLINEKEWQLYFDACPLRSTISFFGKQVIVQKHSFLYQFCPSEAARFKKGRQPPEQLISGR